MITAPTNWNELWAAPGTKLQLRFKVDQDAYLNADIAANSCNLVARLYDRYGIGNACSAKLSIDIFDAAPIDPGIRTCTLECLLSSEDGLTETPWVPQGTYYLNSVEKSHDGRTRLVMYDALALCDQPYYREPVQDTWPKAASAVVAGICTRAKMLYPADDSAFAGIQVSDPLGDTCRDVLCYIAAAAGGNWTVDKTNRLRFVSLASITAGSPVDTITAGTLSETSIPTRVTGVSLDDGAALHEAGTDDFILLEADCPFATDALALAVYARTSACRYQGFKATSAHVSPLIELGDLVSVDGANARMLVDGVNLNYGYPMHGTVESPLRDEAEQRIRFQDPAERKASATRKAAIEAAEAVADMKTTEQALSAAVERIDGEMSAATQKVDGMADEIEEFKDNVNTTVDSVRTVVEDDSQWISTFTNTYLNSLQPDTKLVTQSELSQTAEELQSIIASHYVDDTGAVYQKRRVFITMPQPPYDVGDLWVNAEKAGTMTLWGNLASTSWAEAKQLYTWGNVNLPHEGIYVCVVDKAQGQSYANADWREASNYIHETDLAMAKGELAQRLTNYTTKSELTQTDSELRLAVNDSLAEAKLYTDNGIAAEVVERNAAIRVAADNISLSVQRDYIKTSTYNADIQKYAQKSDLKVYADAIVATVAGTEEVVNPYTGAKVSNQLAAGIKLTNSSITSLVQGNSTYVAPDGTTKTNTLGTKVEQTRTSITSIVQGGATYTAPDGTTKTNYLATKSSVTQTKDSITSLVQGNATYTAPDGTTKTNPLATKSSVTQTATSIRSLVEGDDTYKDPVTGNQVTNRLASKTLVQQTANSWSVEVAGLKQGYATCSTAAATQEKTVTIPKFSMYTGVAITVFFTYSNTASQPKLKVQNSDGSVVANGFILVNNSYMSQPNYWGNNGVVTFVWTGYYWRVADGESMSKLQVTNNSITTLVEGGAQYRDPVTGNYVTNNLAPKSSVTQTADSITSLVTGGSTYKHPVTGNEVTNPLASKSLIEQKMGTISLEVANGQIGKSASIKLSANGSTTTKNIDMTGVRNAFKNDTTAITISAGIVTFNSNTFVVNSTNFSVTSTGVITAKSGTIGGWTIGATSIYNGMASLQSDGIWLKRGGYTIGKIGTNEWDEDGTKRGIVFDLNYNNTSYMAWAAQGSANSLYTWKLLYANRAFGPYKAGTLNVDCPLSVNDGVRVGGYSGGSYYQGRSTTFNDVCMGLSASTATISVPTHYIDSGKGYFVIGEYTNMTVVTGLTWSRSNMVFREGIMTTG